MSDWTKPQQCMPGAIKPAACTKLIVAAIDFGTTFSGYAFSFKHEFQRNPLAISANHWVGGAHISLKAPTTVLFTPGQKFHSFGYEAEDKFTELAEDGLHGGWYYFKRFKMMLHNNSTLSRNTAIKTEDGQSMPAITVFSAAIAYMKGHLMDTIAKRAPNIDGNDVHWVLTVPAIWGDPAKQFMREAAQQAGIQHDSLSLALEPEAAAIYCNRLPGGADGVGAAKGLAALQPGSTYMVIDLGGGTVDIAVHSMNHDRTISEISQSSGGAWGGTQVDIAFLAFLEDIFQDTLREFQQEEKMDYLELIREFEVKKRNVSSSMTGKITIKLPLSLQERYTTQKMQSVEVRISQTKYAGKVILKADKMRLSAEILQELFQFSISQTIKHIRGLMAEHSGAINNVLLVGGFAESLMVQQEICNALPGKSVIVPDDAGLAVLKGGVVFGHDPQVVTSRISKYTYGTEFNANFNPAVHRPDYKIWSNGAYRCRYTLDPFVRANQSVGVNEVVTKTYQSDNIDVTEGAGIYASTSEMPKYVTDAGCFLLGKVFQEEAGHRVVVEMKFGGTEFTVTCHDLNTGKITTDKFDFLIH